MGWQVSILWACLQKTFLHRAWDAFLPVYPLPLRLDLHHKFVAAAGYISTLLFLFEQTQQQMPLTTIALSWLHVWAA